MYCTYIKVVLYFCQNYNTVEWLVVKVGVACTVGNLDEYLHVKRVSTITGLYRITGGIGLF